MSPLTDKKAEKNSPPTLVSSSASWNWTSQFPPGNRWQTQNKTIQGRFVYRDKIYKEVGLGEAQWIVRTWVLTCIKLLPFIRRLEGWWGAVNWSWVEWAAWEGRWLCDDSPARSGPPCREEVKGLKTQPHCSPSLWTPALASHWPNPIRRWRQMVDTGPPPKNGAPMQRGEGKRPPPKNGAPMQRGKGNRAQHSIPTVPCCPISTQPQIKGDSEHICLFSGSRWKSLDCRI